VKVEDWGHIEYESAVAKQLALLESVHAGSEDETLVFCSHPAVVTLGRGSSPEETAQWKGSVYESSRGGRATYHGPNQLVVYPILDLKRAHHGFKERDVHAYLRALENATVAVVREVGLTAAEARTSKVGEISLTGVWAGEKKIASIGIAVRKWITYHGVAINVTNDPSAFVGIYPCGFAPSVMSSLEKELGCEIDKGDFAEICKGIFLSALG
jgi:lipoyl(octanoyl) transferase